MSSKKKPSVFEFTGTVTPKQGDPYVETFFVIGSDEVNALDILNKGNPKVNDFAYTGKSFPCGSTW